MAGRMSMISGLRRCHRHLLVVRSNKPKTPLVRAIALADLLIVVYCVFVDACYVCVYVTVGSLEFSAKTVIATKVQTSPRPAVIAKTILPDRIWFFFGRRCHSPFGPVRQSRSGFPLRSTSRVVRWFRLCCPRRPRVLLRSLWSSILLQQGHAVESF
jgi:hypothetical protein